MQRAETFHAYVMKGMEWAMSDEIHMKGTPFKVSRKVNHEERNQISIHSIDLHRDEESVNEFYAMSLSMWKKKHCYQLNLKK